MKEKADKEFMKDKKTRELYNRELGLNNDKVQIEKAMQQATEYRKYGVNDNNVIIKAMKLENGNDINRASKERIAAAKLAENSKTVKDFQAHMKNFRETPGMSKKQSDKMERMVKQINGNL